MVKKLLQAPRQLKITRKSVRRGLLNRRWVVVVVIIALGAVLLLAVLFLQANKAVSDLKSRNQQNARALRQAVNDTTGTINGANVQDSAGENTAMASLTSLAATADAMSGACVDATKAIVPQFARSNDVITNDCTTITSNAREIRDAVNAFVPIASYQIQLSEAIAPTIAYHRGDSKTDIQKGIEAWRQTRDALQKATVPSQVQQPHTALINETNNIIETLEQASTAKATNDTSAYTARLSELEQRYVAINQLAEPIHEQLVTAQKSLTGATRAL